MDNDNREFIRKNLIMNGIKDVDDDLLDEFIESLKANGDLLSTSNENVPPERSTKRNNYPTRLNQPQKGSRIPKPNTTKLIDEDEEEEEIDNEEEEEIEEMPPKRTQPKQIKSTVNAQRKNTKKSSERLEEDEEINNWSKRLKSIQSKALNLDTQIAECRKAIVDDQVEDEKDIPLYFGTSERKLDPYPTVKKKMSGGFIRPPPVRSSRKTGPKGRRLLYEERNPEYVPPPERRRDELRWQIRQKLIYSDPKYH